jgi:PD-(D/E)XK nuclease superfamily
MTGYNPPRSRNIFTNGSSFSFSRSKIDSFIKCPRCFYIDRKKGIDVPPGFPFNINSAVDTLLKREFDQYRASQTVPKILKERGLSFIPFNHPDIDIWRENFKGLRVEYYGYEFSGAVDDVWINDQKELIVVDYKSTAASEPVTSIDKEYHIGYKRQVEFYQWLLRQMGFKVSNTAYFVYCTGDNTLPEFNGTMKFNIHLITHEGSTEWVEKTLGELIKCIESDDIPSSGDDCDYCKYFNARSSVL